MTRGHWKYWALENWKTASELASKAAKYTRLFLAANKQRRIVKRAFAESDQKVYKAGIEIVKLQTEITNMRKALQKIAALDYKHGATNCAATVAVEAANACLSINSYNSKEEENGYE